jgi:hypothetical protein
MEDLTKPICRLENWTVVSEEQLRGEVYGHPNFSEGNLIYSSEIINVGSISELLKPLPLDAMDHLQKGDRVETRNTIYILGSESGLMEDLTKPICRIENWYVISTPIDTAQLRGEVYGHPNFIEGHLIYTSAISTVTPPNKGRLKKGDKVETINSIYILGEALAPSRLSFG